MFFISRSDILFGSFHTLFGFILEDILLRLIKKKKKIYVHNKVCIDENAKSQFTSGLVALKHLGTMTINDRPISSALEQVYKDKH